MRVLMINVVCGIRSTGRICTDIATELEKQGHEVKIAYGREKVPKEFQKYAVRIGSDFDVNLHVLYARLYDACGWGSQKATKRFVSWVKEFNPDVIHLHNLHGYYINIEILFEYLRTCGKKIIWTLHDCWAFTGHSALCDAVNCEHWVRGCHDCPNRREYPASFIDRSPDNWEKKKGLMTGIPNLTIVTPSEWLAEFVQNSFLAQYQVRVIHNGIDTSQFHSMENTFKESHGIKDKTMLLGVATVWNNMKGFQDYIKLANLIGDKYRIVLVGLRKEQKAQLPSTILGIERTNSVEELAQIYSAADLFLNLSYCENYPTVNLEALACGTPVITYNTGGSPETLTGGYGSIIPKGNIEKLVLAISEMRWDNKPFICNKSLLDKSSCYYEYLQLLS